MIVLPRTIQHNCMGQAIGVSGGTYIEKSDACDLSIGMVSLHKCTHIHTSTHAHTHARTHMLACSTRRSF